MSGQKPEAREKARLAGEEKDPDEKDPRAAGKKRGLEVGRREAPAGEKAEKLRARLALGVRDLGLAEQHATELVRRGFSIVQTAARGVSFEGDSELFQRTFDSEVKVEESPSFEHPPKLPEELQEDVDSVYFPTRPTFHGKERRR